MANRKTISIAIERYNHQDWHLRLFVPVILLPEQWFDLSPKETPCYMLCVAVLEDALNAIGGKVVEVGPVRKKQAIQQEALEWVLSDDRSWPFAFRNVCDVLGFDYEVLRPEIQKLIAPIKKRPIFLDTEL
ncbi:MAG: hypothetical protein AAB691_03045 [Patescibacteria group bacterium]